MKPIIKHSFLSLGMLSLLFLIACQDSFLNITPTDRLSDDAIIADSSLFDNYVVNRYLGIRLTNKEAEGTPPGFGRGFEYALWSTLTDESIYNNDDNTWLIQRGQIAPENVGIAGAIWGRSYRSIRECNYALAKIKDVNMSQSHKNLLIAELKFIRAFRYLDLIRNYGRVVLMGDVVYELNDNFTDPAMFKRSTIDQCIEYTVQQLDESAAGLPTDNNTTNWKDGRATKGAALSLKSRILLYAASPLYANDVNNKEKWQTAANAAKDVMNLNKFSLHSDYSQLFLSYSGNSEIIFARYYAIGARHVCLEVSNGPNGYDGWGGNTPLQNLVDAYEMNNGKSIDNPESGYDPQKLYENRDPRFYATILFNGADYRGRAVELFTPGGKDSKDGGGNWNTSKTGYYLRKFMDDNFPINNPWNISGLQPWIYIRYAEILLNYAEAQNEATGPDASVYSAINLIRQRAGMPILPSGLSQEVMRKRIWNERQVELAFEEHRFYDVRRWKIAIETENVPAYGIDVTKNSAGILNYSRKIAIDGRHFEEKNYWLPIPREEIQSSNNQLEQNPNY